MFFLSNFIINDISFHSNDQLRVTKIDVLLNETGAELKTTKVEYYPFGSLQFFTCLAYALLLISVVKFWDTRNLKSSLIQACPAVEPSSKPVSVVILPEDKLRRIMQETALYMLHIVLSYMDYLITSK